MRVEKKSYGKRILDSFVGVLIGFLLFIGSFIVLFINEGRENLANYARQASEYNQGETYEENDLVYIVGSLSATNFAADNYLKEDGYIYLERIVEMYAYIEHEHTKTRKNWAEAPKPFTPILIRQLGHKIPKKPQPSRATAPNFPKTSPATMTVGSMPCRKM